MLKKITDHLDTSSIIVAATTLILFISALFTKGLAHDFLLEAGIFLISVKLIMATYKISTMAKKLESQLNENTRILKELIKKDK